MAGILLLLVVVGLGCWLGVRAFEAKSSLEQARNSAQQAKDALLHGDTATAIQRLRTLRPAADPGWITWDVWESAASERLLLSELQLATGDPSGAWETAQAFDSQRSQVQQLYLPASLGVRLRAARALNRGADRSRIEARLRALGRSDLVVR